MGEKDAEVIDFTRNGQWDVIRLQETMSTDMVEHIVSNIQPPVRNGSMDRLWWMGDKTGEFTMRSTYRQLRNKK